jgi:SAM-dependent methyltransferase
MPDEPLDFYARHAAEYAARSRRGAAPQLDAFLAALPAGARILELGSGGGQDAAAMLARGFAVDATDGSPELAAEARRLLGVPVRVMRFEELDAIAAYDAVWACASLLHVRRAELVPILRRVHTAVKPGGIVCASFKAGDGEGHDRFGRYYNYPSAAELEAFFTGAGDWSRLAITTVPGGGYDNQPTEWLRIEAMR